MHNPCVQLVIFVMMRCGRVSAVAIITCNGRERERDNAVRYTWVSVYIFLSVRGRDASTILTKNSHDGVDSAFSPKEIH